MTETMQLEVLTPDELVLKAEAESIRVQLADGWWGVLPGHAPFLAHVLAGIMRYRRQKETRYVALYQGTIEVQRRPGGPDRVLVLSAAAEEGEDLAELEQALEQQRARVKKIAQDAHIEFTRARMALAQALHETGEQALVGPSLP